MNGIKRYFIFFLLMPFVAIAGQPKGKFYKHYNLKLSKKDLRRGPGIDRKVQAKQRIWERLQAKKMNACREAIEGESSLFDEGVSPDVLIYRKAAATSCHMSTSKQGQSWKFVFLCTLLLTTQCSGAPPHAYADSNALDGCMRVQNHINAHKADFDGIRERAQKYKDQLGEITFPGTPDLHCPDPNQYHPAFWTVDHARDWHGVGQNFLNAFNQAQGVLNNAIALHNGKIDSHNKQIDSHNKQVACVKQIKNVYRFMDGRSPGLRQEYQDALNAFKQDKDSFCSRPEEQLAADPLITVAKRIGTYIKKVQVGDATRYVHSNPLFLALMRSDDQYIDIAQRIIHELAKGSYSPVLKKHAKSVDKAITKKRVQPEQLAQELDYLISIAQKGGVDAAHLQARINEYELGFLLHGSAHGTIVPCRDSGRKEKCSSLSPRIVCSADGICGMSDAIATQLGGAKIDFVAADAFFKEIRHPIDSAQDILTIFTNRGEYVGQPHLGDGPVDANIRVVDSGHQEASRLFEFCASGHKIKERYNSKIGASIYQLSLDDGTRVTYQQADNSGDDATIIIENMPAWISSDRLEFRFPQ